jgi:DNA-directed DNA polymerase III PolC
MSDEPKTPAEEASPPDPVLTQASGFVHLHNHSEYSSLDGGSKVADMAAKLKSLGMHAMALTDHGVMQGIPSFYEELRKNGIKPILGCEIYLTPERHDKTRGTPTWHLTLLAETTEGYHNLCKLSSRAFIDGTIFTFGRARARADWELLEQHSKGVIAFTGCMASPVMGAIFKGNLSEAKAHTERLVAIYGAENVYGEIQNVGIVKGIPGDSEIAVLLGKDALTEDEAKDMEEVEAGQAALSQTEANRVLVDHICKPLGLKYLATGDTHYLNEEDADPHDVMICIGTGQTKKGKRRFSLLPRKYYMRSEEEMAELLSEWPEALEETKACALRCNAEIEWGRELLPAYPIPDGFEGSGAYLRHLCFEGLEERYEKGTPRYQEAVERLEMELGVIGSMGFNDYFLITWDLYNEANRRNIPSGPGRGSAAGSIVAYTLDITKLCPLEYDLLFERFLNPGRRSMPDVDCDFAEAYNGGRKALIEYAREKYNTLAGVDTAVAQIVTFQRYRGRNAIKDAARALAEPDQPGDDFNKKDALRRGDKLALLIPKDPKATVHSVWEDKAEGAPLRAAHAKGGFEAEVVDEASWLQDMIKTYGLHAAAVIIASHDLTEDLPLQKFKATDPLHTQYDMGFSERIGLLKMDFLGLKNLDIIWEARDKIQAVHGLDINPWRDIPLDDPKTFEMFTSGHTIGTFQFASGGMQSALQEVRPTVFSDLIAVVALYRPGAMTHIASYAARKNGRQEVSYADPRLEAFLKETMGIPVYQEQLLLISRTVAGFEPAEADDLRKAIGKKLRDKMDALKPKFIKGVIDNGGTKELADILWADNEAAADYSFNKCCHAETKVRLADGRRVRLGEAYKMQPKELMAMWPDGSIKPHKVARIVSTGRKPLYQVRTAGGKQIKVTAEHRLLTTEGYLPLSDISVGMELITVPVYTEAECMRRAKQMKGLCKRPERKEQDQRAADRMRAWQAGRTAEEKAAHMKMVHALHPDMTENGVKAMHARVAELWATDPEWVRAHAEASLASVRAVYDTEPGFGRCSIASNGMWCASSHERAMCEWLVEQGIDFEMHKVLPNGRICDFYFDGTYWEMDGMDREDAFFADKYDELPYVVVTPEDFRERVEARLELEHAHNGDPIASIEYWGEGSTFDVEMERGGPLNFIANDIVSHNSHAACYAFIAYITGWMKVNYPHEYMAALLSSSSKKKKEEARIPLTEAKRMGLTVLPPDVNRSVNDFAVREREEEPGEYDIVFALNAVKGVGAAVVDSICEEREAHGPFTSLFDLIRRMPQLNKSTLQALVKGGALDFTGATRKGMFDTVEESQARIKKEREAAAKEFLASVRARAEGAPPEPKREDEDEQQSLALEDSSPFEDAFARAMEGASEPKSKSTKSKSKNKLAAEDRKGLDGGCLCVWGAGLSMDEGDILAGIEAALVKEALRLARKQSREEQEGQAKDEGAAGIDGEEQSEGSAKERIEERAQALLAAQSKELHERAVALLARFLPHITDEVEERASREELDAALASEADPVLSSDEWERIEFLNIERTMLGLYVTGHPLDDDADQWRAYVNDGTERGRELAQITDEDIGNTIVAVGAIVGKRAIRTRNGDIMYSLTLEDLSGSRDMTIFPRTLEGGLESLLEDGRVICVEAGVQEDTFAQAKKDDEDGAEDSGVEEDAEIPIKLIASRLYRWDASRITPEFVAKAKAKAAARAAAEEAERERAEAEGESGGTSDGEVVAEEHHPVKVKVSQEQFNPEWVKGLEAVCMAHPGPHPVKLVLGDKTYRTKMHVAPSDALAQEIKGLLHPEPEPAAA